MLSRSILTLIFPDIPCMNILKNTVINQSKFSVSFRMKIKFEISIKTQQSLFNLPETPWF